MSKRYTFHVEGMSCSHCERAVSDAVGKIAGVKSVSASAPKKIVIVAGDAVNTAEVSTAITEAGYSVTSHDESDAAESADSADSDEEDHSARSFSWPQFALVVSITALVLLVIHRTIGFSFIPQIPMNAGFGIIFIAGLLTSIHCVAMCGGIALSQCMRKSETGSVSRGLLRPALYNAGRIVSYTAVGAVAGALGSVFDFAPAVKGGIMIGAGILMAVMGLRMIGVLSFLNRVRLPLPRIVSTGVLKKLTDTGPFAVGLLNGLIPCGPLQTMQLFAFGTGSALHGALSMFIFSAGTVPLMFVLGAAGSVLSGRFTMTMYKIGGALVVVLGLIMFSNGLNLSGTNVLARSQDRGSGSAVARITNGSQSVTSGIGSSSYQPIVVQKGIPVKWNIRAKADEINGCNNAIIIPEYGVKKKLVPGDNIVTFTPSKSGTVTFTCWMGMISSSIKVVDDLGKKETAAVKNAEPVRGERNGCCRFGR
jgi:sulfite exporter TauE/SafE/copper chaperone CopZ